MLGFLAFSALIPFVIVYLIKSKPVDMAIPSLMFLMKETGDVQKHTFLKRLLRNLLFVLQFLALAFLAFALTYPSISVSYDAGTRHSVIVLDISASMQAKEGSSTRFDKALGIAEKSVKGTTSIILAESSPILILERGTKGKALDLLSGLKAKATGTNIGDAMLLAEELLENKEGKIIVISDFIQTDGPEPEAIKSYLEAKNILVDFIDVSSKRSNFGITNLEITRQNTKVFVKNFNEIDETLTVSVVNEDKEVKRIVLPVLANSVETFTFPTPGGLTRVEILDKDDMPVDNFAYISNPQRHKTKVALITNYGNKFLENALLATKTVDLNTYKPPVFPDYTEYDLVIFSNVSKKNVLPGISLDIKKAAGKGVSFVIMAQDELDEIDYGDVLPVDIEGKSGRSSIQKVIVNHVTKNIDFGTVSEYYMASPKQNAVIIAKADDQTPMLVLKEEENAMVAYYGIIDESSDFKQSPSYPIFWDSFVGFMLGVEDINNFNIKTGKILTFPVKTKIKTPSGNLETEKLIVDEVGLYLIDEKTYGANLIEEKESDINKEEKVTSKSYGEYDFKEVKKERLVSLELYMLMFVLAIVIIEMIYTKIRGDV